MLMVTSAASRDGLKGRPPPRRRPDDFEVMFVEQGRIGCEAWYRARRTTIDRWLDECGKDLLIKRRAEYVAHQRAAGQWMTRSTRLVENRPTGRTPRLQAIRDRRSIDPVVARHAAQHLRIVRQGGFIVSQAQNGDWWVGSKRLSAAQMVDLAASKGFDPNGLIEEPEQAVNNIGGASVTPKQRASYNEDFSQRWLHENGNADYRFGREWKDDSDLDADLHPQSGRQVKGDDGQN